MVASFTPEELKTIADAPIFVGLAVSMVDLGIISTVPEAAALAKEVVGAAKKYPNNDIIQTVFSEASLKSGAINFERSDIKAEDVASGVLIEQAIMTINAALDLLNSKATPEEITEYKGFIYTCAEAVANAAGSGLFGTGTKVSDQEAEALTRFKSVLLN